MSLVVGFDLFEILLFISSILDAYFVFTYYSISRITILLQWRTNNLVNLWQTRNCVIGDISSE